MRFKYHKNPDGSYTARCTAGGNKAILGDDSAVSASAIAPTAQEAVRRAALRLYRADAPIDAAERQKAKMVAAAADPRVHRMAMNAAGQAAETAVTSTPMGAVAWWAGKKLSRDPVFRRAGSLLWGAARRNV